MRSAVLLAAALATAAAQVPYERILKSAAEPGNWLTYSGNYAGHRHSPLKEIHTGNVARLRPAWVYQISARHKFEATPLVVDGTMYVAEPPSDVSAIDTRAGKRLWTYRRQL